MLALPELAQENDARLSSASGRDSRVSICHIYLLNLITGIPTSMQLINKIECSTIFVNLGARAKVPEKKYQFVIVTYSCVGYKVCAAASLY
jgi:hypothetical protein